MKNKIIFLISIYISLSHLTLVAQTTSDNALKIKTIPFALTVKNNPSAYQLIGDSVLQLEAAGKTNLFSNPGGGYQVYNAPMVLFRPDEQFTLVAKITAKHEAIYDVAALVIYQNDDYWAKFCFENSVDKKPIIVSVVNRKYSDDCNSVYVTNDFAYLAIVKNGLNVSLHYSANKYDWIMIRNFRLESVDNLQVGFAVHGSKGNGFKARFSEISYEAKTPGDFRKIIKN